MDKCRISECSSFDDGCPSNCSCTSDIDQCEVKNMLLNNDDFKFPISVKKCENKNCKSVFAEGAKSSS